ncbi:MAG: DMT family transporter [Proteobacteria bacterium]|nr:DMT family transporter [Pseudomonadota bacterium]
MSNARKVTKGLVFALAACTLWSTLYIHTDFIAPYGTADLAIVRFLFSTALALLVAVLSGNARRLLVNRRYQDWLSAGFLGFLGFTGYFFFLATAIKYTSEVITVSVIGMIAIVTMVANNLIYKEFPWRSIVWPVLLAIVGVVIIVGAQIQAGQFSLRDLRGNLGLASAFIALAMWSSYQVLNKRALLKHSAIPTEDWTLLTLIAGAAALPLLIVVLPFSPVANEFGLFTHPVGAATLALAGWGFFLAVGASLLSLYAWNTAQTYLPPALSGQSVVLLLPLVFGLGWHYGRFSQSSLPIGIGIVFLLGSVAGTIVLRYRVAARARNDQRSLIVEQKQPVQSDLAPPRKPIAAPDRF